MRQEHRHRINVADTEAMNEMCERLRNELWFRGERRFQAKDCYIPPDLRDLNRGASTESAELIDELIRELTTGTYDPDSKRSAYSTRCVPAHVRSWRLPAREHHLPRLWDNPENTEPMGHHDPR